VSQQSGKNFICLFNGIAIVKDLSESVESDPRALSSSSPEQSMQNDGSVDLPADFPDHQLPAVRTEMDFGTLVISNERKTRYVSYNSWARLSSDVFYTVFSCCDTN
jgi:hypothetical protein